jgi:peroxiredoxin
MLGAGDTAPDFHLQDMHGHEKSLQDFIATKPTLIAIFKVSCPVCQYTLPFLERLAESDNIEVIGISQDDLESTREFQSEYGITFATLLDESKKSYPVSDAFGITTVPSIFLIEPDAQISMAEAGFSRQDLEDVGKIAGVKPFRPGENVPEFKAG